MRTRRTRRNKIEHVTNIEQIQADVAVLGTGGAGMASAITAAEGGAKVVLLEKRPFPGGASNTPVGFGFVKRDRESKDKAFKVHMEGTLWTANADLARAFIDTSGEIPVWLKAMGVQVDIPDQRTQPMTAEPAPGAGRFQAAIDAQGYCSLKAIGRGHGGAQLIKTIVARARELGVKILFSTPGRKILRAGDRVTGVYADTRTGDTINVDAGAVVIATAGFNEDSEMVKKYSGYEFTLDWYA